MRPSLTLGAGLLVAIVASAAATAQTPARRIAGDVVRFDAGVLEVKTAAGESLSVKLADKARISTRAASDLAHVQQGGFIGTTAAPRADGTLVASEVHIFPEAMRGTGEGHRPMTGNNTMTNATVSKIAGGATRNTMTNATVANVAKADGERTLTLTYRGGQTVVVVPADTPIMTIDTGDPSMLVPGAHVVVYATTGSDGGLTADRVSVGKDGYVPPL